MTDDIAAPYLLFIGDAPVLAAAKTAAGLAYWRPDKCLGQFRLPSCRVDLGLADMTPRQAAAAGARTMIIGIASAGGQIPESWLPAIEDALAAGLDIAAGLHQRLSDTPAIQRQASRLGRRLFDVRYTDEQFPVGRGKKRSGKRVLTVGTDCAVGKKYAALALERALRDIGVKADFRATGQTGILIAGEGVPIDAVKADFLSGAAESLTPDHDDDHWDVIEGQGSLFHPAYAGVALGLIHGSQPDALVVCHEPGRETMVGFDYPVPPLSACIERCVEAARLTNPACKPAGVSVNTSLMNAEEARAVIDRIENETGLPCGDPVRGGLANIAASLAKW